MVVIFRLLRSSAVLIAGVSLLYLGVPRFIAAVVTLPSGPILNKIQTNRTVDAKALDIFIKSQKRGLQWNESARRWTDLGLAQIILANDAGNENSRIALLDKAEESLVRGLSLGPSNAFAWTRLAYIDMARNGLSATVTRKLRLAVAKAPYDRRLVFARLRLCFLNWTQFDEADRPMVLEQTRFAWNIDHGRLVSRAVKLGRIGLVRAALFANPDDIGQFETLLKKYRG
jgi:hypothetical protein